MSSSAPATSTPMSLHRSADLVAHRAFVVNVLTQHEMVSSADQDDYLQDVWVRALHSLPGCPAAPEELPRWLAVIATRVVIDAGRVSRSRRRFMVNGTEGAAEWAPAREPSAERTLHLRNLIAQLWTATKTMPRPDREVFDLYVNEGLSHAVIATRLSITEAASKMRCA